MKKYRATVIVEVKVGEESVSEASLKAKGIVKEMDERGIVAGIGAIYTECVDEIDDEQEDEE